MSLFEGFKRAVLHINNDYWKRTQGDKDRLQLNHSFQHYIPKLLRQKISRSHWANERNITIERMLRSPASSGITIETLFPRNSISNVLGVVS